MGCITHFPSPKYEHIGYWLKPAAARAVPAALGEECEFMSFRNCGAVSVALAVFMVPVVADATTKAVKLKSGVAEIVDGASLTNISTCTSGGLPTVRILTPPQHGVVEVKKIEHKIGKGRLCEGMKIKGNYVIYRSNPGYRGTDTLVVDKAWDHYTNSPGISGETTTVEITVE